MGNNLKERVEGLAKMSDILTLQSVIKNITDDLRSQGFSLEDIKEFINDEVADICC